MVIIHFGLKNQGSIARSSQSPPGFSSLPKCFFHWLIIVGLSGILLFKFLLMGKLTPQIGEIMRNYPRGSQMKKSKNRTLILVRLYDVSFKTNYWLSEYDQETKTAYGYITTPSGKYNKWAEIPIYELERLRILNAFQRVFIDEFFTPKKFKDLAFNNKKDS